MVVLPHDKAMRLGYEDARTVGIAGKSFVGSVLPFGLGKDASGPLRGLHLFFT